MSVISKQSKQARRRKRVRSKVSGTALCPRVSVRVSLTGMFVQFIDDGPGKTIISGRDKGLKGTKTDRAGELGKSLANQALKKEIKSVVFDRGSKKYHGRVKALADALRAGGLEF